MWAFVAALLSHSSFAPDEFYQSAEPSLCLLDLPCISTWEWTVPAPIRTSLPLYLYSGFYRAVTALHPLLSVVPAVPFPLLTVVLAALLSAVPLHAQFRCSSSSLISSTWFLFYAGCRSYSNAVEMALCNVVFSLLHSPSPPPYPLLGVLCALAITVRFSAGVFFLPLFLHHLISLLLPSHTLSRASISAALSFLLRFFPPLLLSLALLHALDMGHYDMPLLSPPITWNNIEFNVLTNSSELYGVHPWHWCVRASTRAERSEAEWGEAERSGVERSDRLRSGESPSFGEGALFG
jgi:hypothetical protein